MTESPPRTCRPRFKGIENFLRRVAYNLGNTPSQTEVKIISCIPIDVTDLQHKILSLEKELDDMRLDQNENCNESIVNTALISPLRIRPQPSTHVYTSAEGTRDFNALSFTSSKEGKSSSSVCPSLIDTSPTKVKINDDACKPNRKEESDRLQKLLKKVKNMKNGKRRDKCNTQYVYYAQAMNSPFAIQDTSKDYTSKDLPLKDAISRAYLSNMVRKQYKPDKMVEELSATSQFSSPICRDVAQSCDGVSPYESDMCSCCRGPFCNVDHTAKQTRDLCTSVPINQNAHVNRMYYDTSLYDLVPVRERPAKAKDEDNPKKKEAQMEFRNYPERSYTKSRFQPYNDDLTNLRCNLKGHKRKLAVKLLNRMTPKPKYKQQVETTTSNAGSVDCGDIYMKAIYGNRMPQKITIPKVTQPAKPTVLLKNAECLAISVNNTECQTASTKSVQLDPPPPLDDAKTEATLNQIKSILQSVLTEVKTSTQVRNIPEETPKKDADVQKVPSQSNIQTCSSLMNSFSYSPYNITPYAPSCSRQVNNNLYYTGTSYPPARCLQNYPLFLQTTGRQCTCCFRNMPSGDKSAYTKHATTTATNTEALASPQRSKETDNLIKEIYKSIALNLDSPAKDTSNSEGEGLKSANNSNKVFEFRFIPKKDKSKETSSTETKNNDQNTATKPTVRAAFGSNVVSQAASMRSQPVGRTPEPKSLDSYMKEMRMSSGSERGRERKHMPYVVELPNGTSYSDVTDTPDSDDDESDDTIVPSEPEKKREKAGLFSKMVKLFKSKSKKKEEEEMESESEENDSEASDSDYETVYSQRSRKQPKHVTYVDDRARYKPRPHSKVAYSRYYMNRNRPPERQIPYMEQEYRRYWNEDLAFHGGSTPRYSSERFSRGCRENSRQNPHRQSYEARSMYQQKYNPVNVDGINTKPSKSATKGFAWFKKPKLGLGCGEQWKKFVLES